MNIKLDNGEILNINSSHVRVEVNQASLTLADGREVQVRVPAVSISLDAAAGKSIEEIICSDQGIKQSLGLSSASGAVDQEPLL